MENIRNSVDKREIIQYLKLRERTLSFSANDHKDEKDNLKILRIRISEMSKLLNRISKDTIRKENKKMQKAFYLRRKKEEEK